MKFLRWLWDIIKRFLLTPAAWTVKPPVEPPVEPQEPPVVEPPIIEPPVEPPVVEPPVEPPIVPPVEPPIVVEPPAPPIVVPPHLPPIQPNGIVLKPEWNPTQFLIPTWTDQEWLAHIIRGEARGEPEAGQIAVGNVILNRVRYDGWGDSIPKVIVARFQFTPCWNTDGTINTKFFNYDASAYMAVAKKILDGAKAIPDNYYYFSVGKARKYAQDFVQIGGHWFGKIRTVPLDAEDRLIEWGFELMMNIDPIHKGVVYAVKQFQAAMGLTVDGIVGAQTTAALNGEVIVPRIPEVEVECQCYKYCNAYPAGVGMSIAVRILAERIFKECEKKFPGSLFFLSNRTTPTPNGAIAGGYRCVKWAEERGSSASSRHVDGDALDIYGVKEGVDRKLIRAELERIALEMNTKGGVGYGAAYIVHIDTRGRKSRWAY